MPKTPATQKAAWLSGADPSELDARDPLSGDFVMVDFDWDWDNPETFCGDCGLADCECVDPEDEFLRPLVCDRCDGDCVCWARERGRLVVSGVCARCRGTGVERG